MSTKTYKENPSIKTAMVNTKKGAKFVFGNNNQTDISIYENNTEELKTLTLDFCAKRVVDKDEFIKIYIHSLPVLSELKNSTKILYQYILYLVHQSIGQDRFYISYKDYCERVESNKYLVKVSQATFYRALDELLEKQLLFKSNLTNLYFINIAYVFNGDRLRFITEYQLKNTNDGGFND